MTNTVSIPYQFKEIKNKIVMAHCNGRDQVVFAAYKNGWKNYESPVPEVLSLLLSKENSIFIDVGANTGYYSLIAALLKVKEIHAFEPFAPIAKIYLDNVVNTLNTFPSFINFNQLALSDSNGTAKLFIPSQEHGLIETSASLNSSFRSSHSEVLTVKKKTLDSYFSKKELKKGFNYILKIDAETCEPEILKGGNNFISSYRPFVIVEILPESDLNFYSTWTKENNYIHYELKAPYGVYATTEIKSNSEIRDHLFLPKETDPKEFGLVEIKRNANFNLAVYSTFCGSNKNKTFNPMQIDVSCPHYFVSNNEDVLAETQKIGWIPIYLEEPVSDDPILSAWQAKYAKAMPHLIEPICNYDFTFYKDDKINFDINKIKDLIEILKKENFSLMLRPHDFLFENILYEFGEAMLQPRYKILWNKTVNYMQEELNKGASFECQLYWTSAILRNMKHADTEKINNKWMKHVNRCGIECQISFDIIAQSFNSIGLMPLKID